MLEEKTKAIETVKDTKIYQHLMKIGSKFTNQIDNAYIVAEDILKYVITLFPTYTGHDIKHSVRVIKYMDDLIYNLDELSELELASLILVALFHDIGMCVTEKEIEETKKNIKSNETIDVQNYIRKNHAARFERVFNSLKGSTLAQGLFFIPSSETSFFREINKIIIAHTQNFSFIKKELANNNFIGTFPMNSQYIAILLRIADLLDMDDRRTPRFIYDFLEPRGISDDEWQKHFDILNHTKIMIDEANNRKYIALHGVCRNSKIHKKLLDYIKIIDEELKNANELLNKQKEQYYLKINNNVERNIIIEGFKYLDIELTVKHDAVINLLIGESLYSDKKYALRELIQNSIDTCKHASKHFEKEDDSIKYIPKIHIILEKDNNKVKIIDNGMGMSEEIIKNYFLNVGSSYYKSDEFNEERNEYRSIGNFGIGFLSCFMITDEVHIKTKHYKTGESNCFKLVRGDNYVYFENTCKFNHYPSGTVITLDYDKFLENFKIDDFTKEYKKYKKNNEEVDGIINFIEENFLDVGIDINILYDNGKNYDCKLRNISNENGIRLDEYLNGIEVLIESSHEKLNLLCKLSQIDSGKFYIYEDNKFIEATGSENINDFIKNDEIVYFSILAPQIFELKKKLEFLNDFEENNYNKMPNDFINFVSKDKDIKELFKYGKGYFQQNYHSRINIQNVIKKNDEKILAYEKHDGDLHIGISDGYGIYLKNILITDTLLVSRSAGIISNVDYDKIIINIKNEKITPNVSRNSFSEDIHKKLTYAIIKAYYLWIIDNYKSDSIIVELVKIFVDKFYKEDNEFLNPTYK